MAFDSNYRPRLWPDAATARREIGAIWALTDIGLPSLDDEMALFGEADAAAVLARLAAAGVTRGALKRGAEGPLPLGAVRGAAGVSRRRSGWSTPRRRGTASTAPISRR